MKEPREDKDGRSKKPRRGHNEGSYTLRKDGRWMGRITLANGKRYAFYGKTKEEVKNQLLDALKNKKDDRPIISGKQTVGQFLAQWLETTKPTVRLSTYTRYEEYVRLHTVPELSKVKLSQLTPHHLQKLYSQKLSAGLSSMSVRHLHAVIHRALAQALRWGMVATNVADATDPPRVERRELHVLTIEQARRLMEAARGARFEALYVLALSTGLRQGELLGLHWKEVDLENGYLSVVGTLQRSHHGLAISEPKTARSRRKVMLTQAATNALRQHRIRQMEERLKAGPLWEDSGLAFPNETGKPMDAGNLLRRDFSPLLKRAGLSHIRFHDLRHTAATLLLSQGINPKVIQEMLGHSSITLTLDTYSHVLPTMQREAREAMEAVLQRSS